MLTLLETIDVDSLLTNGGIFSKIASTTNQPFEWLTTSDALTLDHDYYFGNSGKKIISSLFNNLISLEHSLKISDALQKLSDMLILRFNKKWNALYDSLIASEYVPIENYSMEQIRTPDLTHATEEKAKQKQQLQRIKVNQFTDLIQLILYHQSNLRVQQKHQVCKMIMFVILN